MPNTIPHQVDPDYLEEAHTKRHFEDIDFELSEEDTDEKKKRVADLGLYIFNREELAKKYKEIIINTPDPLEALDRAYEELDGLPRSRYGELTVSEAKSEQKLLNKVLSAGKEVQRTELFALPYYDLNRMGLYTKEGRYIYDRSLQDNERQSSILNISAKSA
ncbi:hypothetical protein [Lewinella sp. W8]|uniref:hypothetical protein n=1 Tax=Lewinella sp. W8 TaxID=2528208 RepID=UPI001068AB9B|nr:hypothetical protein [Lewinella sp. W8]MTB53078.1 hypothetical protein [Lewinella sp. W8]